MGKRPVYLIELPNETKNQWQRAVKRLWANRWCEQKMKNYSRDTHTLETRMTNTRRKSPHPPAVSGRR
ncbi:MAG: hypothetical protein F6K65_05705 [Moorea sp. SIO3C2]|nr:hypothetical protein [Moorena sp. SIO3C2]